MIFSSKYKTFQLTSKKVMRNWACVQCARNKGSVEPKIKTYSNTILFPKTKFPARSSNAQREDLIKSAKFCELYNWQRDCVNGSEFVLHDGPPYANGDLHMGHAVNKIIKDICNRHQLIQGNRVHYVPGWDCHGLPIELKATQKSKFTSPNPIDMRSVARDFALETVEKQKGVFESWGVMADWDKQYYLTLNADYVCNQLRRFYEMFQSNLIFRALKPVYWSPSSETALAEAELEYDPQYKSREVYVEFPFADVSDTIRGHMGSKNVFALIWTTTPWTLVANKAVCYNSKIKYTLVNISKRNPENVYVIASSLIDSMQNLMDAKMERIAEFEGGLLKGSTYVNTLLNQRFPLLDSSHVTEVKGTGLVHCAPAHGPDDFLVGLKNNLSVECNVDESGRYINVDPKLNGLSVLKEGQDAVISLLGDAIHHQGLFIHSYPLDWRTKKPVIIRASQQWFIDTGALKSRALEALKGVTILPEASSEQYRQGLQTQLEKRPYWCISRQRKWGTPIPALYVDGRPLVDGRIVERLCDLIQNQGPDVWWTSEVSDLIPESVFEEYNLRDKEITKGNDILDIWLDSGLSWSQVLDGRQADVYVEGIDQFTGWFQSSLLTSVALRDRAPYKSIFVHGFVVDEKKRKMSKSLGNIIDPITITDGGRDKNRQPAYGVDTLRWWVASHAVQHSQIIISKKLLEDCQTEIARIRNIFKYLLGVVDDLDKSAFYTEPDLNYFDRYILRETHEFRDNIAKFYDSYKYNHASQLILFFISNQVSGLYCHCVKDRLYCSSKNSKDRINSQLVINTILVLLCKSLAPILPHLIEEVWSHHPLFEKPYFYTNDIPVLSMPRATDTSLMDVLLEIKKDLCAITKNENLRKFHLNIEVNNDKLQSLDESELCEVLEVSSASVKVTGEITKWRLQVSKSGKNQCLRCRKYNAMDDSDKCTRCEQVLI